jgi:hypothetical protein
LRLRVGAKLSEDFLPATADVLRGCNAVNAALGRGGEDSHPINESVTFINILLKKMENVGHSGTFWDIYILFPNALVTFFRRNCPPAK